MSHWRCPTCGARELANNNQDIDYRHDRCPTYWVEYKPCRNCGDPEEHHGADGKCLFAATRFEATE